MEPKSVIGQDFDRTGQYDSGLQSLVKSLKWAFAFLLVVIIGMLIYFFTGGGYFSVEPQRAVIVVNFGRITETFTTGGHWFIPYPVNRFIEVQTNPQTMSVDFLAANGDAESPEPSLEPGKDNYLLTGDANIIHASWTLSYRVNHPERYYTTVATPAAPVVNGVPVDDDVVRDADGFAGTRGPQTLIRNLFKQAVIRVTSQLRVEEVLSQMQVQYTDSVQREFKRLVAETDCGVEIVNVTLERVFPPVSTKAAFEEVSAASNTQSTIENRAREYQVQLENRTLADAAEIIASAETYRKRVVSEVKAESSYFQSIHSEYAKNPKTVLMALYTNTLSDVLKNQENIFVLGTGSGKGSKKLWMKLNPEPKKQAAAPSGEAK